MTHVFIARCAPFVRNGILLLSIAAAGTLLAEDNSKKPASEPDVLILSNGDTLHGKLISEVGGKVTFHSEALGDLTVEWGKIKELHSAQRFAVLDKNVKERGRKTARVPAGTLEVKDEAITVHDTQTVAPIPTKNAQYIVDEPTLDKQLYHEPSFLAGWNGAATAGATLVKATQSQYTVSGALALVRTVPTVRWMNPRNRTSANFSGSYGKITQPSYISGGVLVPAQVTKSSIYHVDGERDQYVSPRFFALVQTAFDHNFSQDLQLQQIYGGGMGWTVFNTPQHEADLKATIQYEKQQFINGTAGTNQDLIGSTFAANYMLKTKLITYTQGLEYIASYNVPRAYSASESNTLTFPTYKNLGFSLGTIDTYLNNPPIALPPPKRNSFQFTMGLTYAIKSKY